MLRNAALATALLSTPAYGAIAFDNFGPGFSYDGGTGFFVGVDGFGITSVGARFTSSATGPLDRLWVAANALNPTANDGLVYTVRADGGGEPDGALASVAFDDVCLQADCPTGQLLAADFTENASLQSGVSYWLVASTTDADSSFFWFAASADEGGGLVWIQNDLFPDGQTFELPQQPVFRIDVVGQQVPGEVPEPPGVLLAFLVLLALAVQRRLSTCQQ